MVAFLEGLPTAACDGEHAAVVHHGVVQTAAKRDHFLGVPEGHDDAMADSEEVSLGQRFFEESQRFCEGVLGAVGEMEVANVFVAADVAEFAMCDAFRRLPRFQD